MLAHTVIAAAQSASASYSGGRGVAALAIGGLSAWRGYVRAERVEHETGRRPWGWSPTVWSVLCFFSLVIGRLCLRAAADRAAKQPRLQPAGPPMAPSAPVFAAPAAMPFAAPAPVPAEQFAATAAPTVAAPTAPAASMPAASRSMTILPER
jgi:hypothetical protein